MSVEAIDVVTAAGELVRADESTNPDLFWAARGSGPGFFGAVARFHLRLYPGPGTSPTASTSTRSSASRRSSAGSRRSGRGAARTMELMVVVHRDLEGAAGDRGHRRRSLAGDAEEAAEALALLEACPRASGRSSPFRTLASSLADLYAAVHELLPRRAPLRRRQHVDPRPGRGAAAGSSANRRDAAAGAVAHAVDELGAEPGRVPRWPTASRTTPTSPSTASGRTPPRTRPTRPGPTERMREMEGLASGIQLADENLGRRPARFATDEQHGAARRGACRLRPGRPLPSLDGAALSAVDGRPGARALSDAADVAPRPRGAGGDRGAGRSTARRWRSRSPRSTACSTRPRWRRDRLVLHGRRRRLRRRPHRRCRG